MRCPFYLKRGQREMTHCVNIRECWLTLAPFVSADIKKQVTDIDKL